MPGETHCPLCNATDVGAYHQDRYREYWQCLSCQLVFVPSRYFLSPEQEKAEYDRHQNDPDDPGYRKFLDRLATPLLQRLPAQSAGLDFGCGPGPALAQMLQERGHRVALYDTFYFPDHDVLRPGYDFICATEVVEHLHRPGEVLHGLWQLLSSGGCLAVMTKLVRDQTAFARWHYIRDPTHVCFFSIACWTWWAQQHAADLQVLGDDVLILSKTRASD